MTNRLPMNKLARIIFCAYLIFTGSMGAVYAQQSAFNFAYPGPNVLALGSDCTTPLEPQLGTPLVSSAVGANVIISEFDSLGSGFGLYTTDWVLGEIAGIHWYVEDDMGNSATFIFFVTFDDLTGPVYDVMGVPTLIEVNSLMQVPPIPNLPLTDNCTPFGLLDASFVETARPDTCEGGSFTRTWMATDTSGNSTTFIQTIVVYNDTLPPQVLVSPQNGSAPCEQVDTAYVNWLAAQMDAFEAIDASTPITYTNNAPATFPPGCVQPVTVIFTATDYCGRKSTRTAVFTSFDTEPPVIDRSPKDSIGYCSYGGDEISALANWISRNGGMEFHDACSDLDEQTVTMYINGNLRDSAQVISAFLASFADGCGTQMIGTNSYDQVRGKVTVDFFVTDPCDSSSYGGKATFAAIDTLPPMILGDSLYLEACGGVDDQTQLESWIENHGGATLDDDCSGATWTSFNWTTSTGNTGAGVFGSGPYPQAQAFNCTWYVDVSFRATDECGNIGVRTLRFQIFDDEAPVFSNFGPDTLYCPDAFPTVYMGTVSDNCDPAPGIGFSYAFSDTTCVGNYTLSVTWTATDSCGNSNSVVQTFFVRDTVAPVFDLVPAGFDASCETYMTLTLPVVGVDVTAADVCGELSSIVVSEQDNQNPDPGTCGFYDFNLIRVFTATDVCGNTSTATQVVHVRDSLGPVFTGFLDTTAVCETPPAFDPPVLSDNCSGVATGPSLVSEIITPGACTDNYTITYTWSATDVCGNATQFSQDVLVLDTIAPTLAGIPVDLVVACDSIPIPPDSNTFTSSDNCDALVDIGFSEIEIRDPNTANCAHWTNYIIQRVWTATDNCGNTRAYTQNIQVEDNAGPEITMPSLIALPSSMGLCGTNIIPPGPISIHDVCTSQASSVLLTDTIPLLTAGGSNSATEPVGTLVFNWVSPNTPPIAPVTDSVTITVSLRNADGESMNEFMWVYGENNVLIGRTASTPAACMNSDTSFKVGPNVFNTWLTDGNIEITLAPNGSGTGAINPYCPGGGSAIVSLDYSFAAPAVPVQVTFNIDGGMEKVYPTVLNSFFSVGNHVITYTATDCAGNSTTATLEVQVTDVEAPSLNTTPPSVAYVGPVICNTDVLLPFPGIMENCGMSGLYTQNTGLYPVRFYLDDNAGVVPAPMSFTFSGAVPNAITGGTIRILHRGDNGQTGEFFEVYDEDNTGLSITNTNSGITQCTDFVETIIPISASDINNWAADGSVTITLVANTDVLNFSDFIGPCAPVMVDSTDGQSVVQVFLEYDYAIVNYQVRKGAAGPVLYSGPLLGNQTEVNLAPGMYTVTYSTTDAVGLVGTTNYPLEVRDTIRPTANCVNKTIFVNASGEVNYTLLPSEINNGSFDNCSGTNLTLSASPNVFTCNMAGSLTPVTLTVTDTSGNSSTCVAQVRVETAEFFPDFNTVCLGDTLELFANPPSTPGGDGIFTYSWTGPPSWSSSQQNPKKNSTSQMDEGTYTVVITGLTGCTATGMVQVDLLDLPDQPLLIASDVCIGDDIVLSTNGLSGNDVTYCWYTGTLLNPVLLGETTDPIFTITNPTVGQYNYFVQIKAIGCSSMFSLVKTVKVKDIATPSVTQSSFDLCTCQALTLGTNVQGPDITYSWTGPNGFTSTLQFPPVNNCVSLSDSGIYTLVIYKNGCASPPVTVDVDVTQGPPTPIITGAAGVCVGDSLTLSVNNIAGAAQFIWTRPNQTTTITPTNMLTLDPITLQDSGVWRVQVVQNSCVSMQSTGVLVQVQPYPVVLAESNSPVCADIPLTLSASVSNISLPITYTWKGPNGYMGTGPNPSAPTVAGQYIVTANTSFMCANKDTIDVVVIANPVIDTVFSNAPVCTDGSTAVQLFSSITSGNPPNTYQWLGPNGFNPIVANPVIPAASSVNSGTYVLTVFNSFGCKSLPESILLDIHDIPATPIIQGLLPYCEGSNVVLQLANVASYQNGTFTFSWTHLSNMDMVDTTHPVLYLPNAQVDDSGFYTVQVSSDTCSSQVSIPVELEINSIPQPPIISTNANPICEGATLQLSVPQTANASYSWSGPAGFSSSIYNPVIPNVSEMNEGVYFCIVTVDGCSSLQGEGLFVEVLPRPQAPVLKTISAVCLDQVDTLTLMMTNGSTTAGAMYHWYDIFNEELPGSPTAGTTLLLTDLSSLSPGLNGYYVVAEKDGCFSAQSTVQTVQADTIPPNMASAGQDHPACDDSPIMLAAAVPPPGSITGSWAQVSGPNMLMISNPNLPSTEVNGHIAGNQYGFVWTLSNGACTAFSRDTVLVNAVSFEAAQLCADFIDTCFAESVQLCANQGQNATGEWSQIGQQQFGVTIVDSLNPNTIVTNLEYGQTYFFTWTLQDIGCGESEATVTVRNIGSIAYAGDDMTICDEDSCAVLSAQTLPDGETGLWTSADPTISIASPTSEITNVCGLKVGKNTFYWTTNEGNCGDDSRDTVVITYELTPIVRVDSIFVPFGAKVDFNVLLNDILPQQYAVSIVDLPSNGRLDLTSQEGVYSYQPDIGFVGTDKMTYKVCNLNCVDACNVAQVVLLVEEADACEVPTVITPNNDGVNDVFFVPCLDTDGVIDNELWIYNQWGDEVYHAQPYDNTWKGTYNGEPVPSGTYFFVVKFNGEGGIRTGFLIIQY